MEFLFHTVLEFDGVPVYYNIYQDNGSYYAEILDNPGRVVEAKNFRLENVDGRWCCSELLPANVVEIVGEEINKFIKRN